MKCWALSEPKKSNADPNNLEKVSNFRNWDMKNMNIDKIEIPKPGKKEVLIKVSYIGLNPVDYKVGSSMNNFPHVLGVDCSGIVEELGEGVTTLKKGDRVMIHKNLSEKIGTYSEYFVIKEHVVCVIPKEMKLIEAACIPCAGYTAYQAIVRRMKLQKGESILIHGGSGGTGSFGIQIAKAIGAKIITTASPRNFEFCKSIGADYVIDYKDPSLVKKVLEIFPDGVNCVYSTYSPEQSTEAFQYLGYQGRLSTITGAPDFSKHKGFAKCISWMEIGLGCCYSCGTYEDQADLRKMGEEMSELYKQKKLECPIAVTYPFEKLREGLMRLLKRDNKLGPGKIIVEVCKE